MTIPWLSATDYFFDDFEEPAIYHQKEEEPILINLTKIGSPNETVRIGIHVEKIENNKKEITSKFIDIKPGSFSFSRNYDNIFLNVKGGQKICSYLSISGISYRITPVRFMVYSQLLEILLSRYIVFSEFESEKGKDAMTLSENASISGLTPERNNHSMVSVIPEEDKTSPTHSNISFRQ